MKSPFVALRDLVELKTGTRNPGDLPETPFSYVDVASVNNAEKCIHQARTLVGRDAPSRARKVIQAGDVIVSTVRPNLNAVALIPSWLDGAIASTGFCVLRAGERVLPEYLYFFARSARFVAELSRLVAGAMYPAVTDAQVLSQQVSLPDQQDQARIVDLLTRAESIVRLRREAAAKAAELIPALFIDLFGDPATNPKGWPVQLLGELLQNGPNNGLYKHKSAYGRGTPILRIDAFYDGSVTDLNSLKRVELQAKEIDSFALAADDIVINRVNSPEYLGKSAIVPPLPEATVFESNMMRFAADRQRVLPRYLIALLQTRAARDHFLGRAKHAINQSSINQQDVKSLPVPVPAMPSQLAFCRQAQAVEGLMRQQATALAKAQATFDALLAQAFAPAAG